MNKQIEETLPLVLFIGRDGNRYSNESFAKSIYMRALKYENTTQLFTLASFLTTVLHSVETLTAYSKVAELLQLPKLKDIFDDLADLLKNDQNYYIYLIGTLKTYILDLQLKDWLKYH